MPRPPITIEEVLALADAWFAKYGCWPKERDNQDWNSINAALREGRRGLPGGTTLARLLAEHRGLHHPLHQPRLTLRRILAWAKAHHRRTKRWPNAQRTGPRGARRELAKIDEALRCGLRGLARGTTLARLLEDHLGIQTHGRLPEAPLTLISGRRLASRAGIPCPPAP